MSSTKQTKNYNNKNNFKKYKKQQPKTKNNNNKKQQTTTTTTTTLVSVVNKSQYRVTHSEDTIGNVQDTDYLFLFAWSF